MKAHFLVTLDMPEWAAKPDRLEMIREEIQQHAAACGQFYTRAAGVTATTQRIQTADWFTTKPE